MSTNSQLVLQRDISSTYTPPPPLNSVMNPFEPKPVNKLTTMISGMIAESAAENIIRLMTHEFLRHRHDRGETSVPSIDELDRHFLAKVVSSSSQPKSTTTTTTSKSSNRPKTTPQVAQDMITKGKWKDQFNPSGCMHFGQNSRSGIPPFTFCQEIRKSGTYFCTKHSSSKSQLTTEINNMLSKGSTMTDVRNLATSKRIDHACSVLGIADKPSVASLNPPKPGDISADLFVGLPYLGNPPSGYTQLVLVSEPPQYSGLVVGITTTGELVVFGVVRDRRHDGQMEQLPEITRSDYTNQIAKYKNEPPEVLTSPFKPTNSTSGPQQGQFNGGSPPFQQITPFQSVGVSQYNSPSQAPAFQSPNPAPFQPAQVPAFQSQAPAPFQPAQVPAFQSQAPAFQSPNPAPFQPTQAPAFQSQSPNSAPFQPAFQSPNPVPFQSQPPAFQPAQPPAFQPAQAPAFQPAQAPFQPAQAPNPAPFQPAQAPAFQSQAPNPAPFQPAPNTVQPPTFQSQVSFQPAQPPAFQPAPYQSHGGTPYQSPDGTQYQSLTSTPFQSAYQTPTGTPSVPTTGAPFQSPDTTPPTTYQAPDGSPFQSNTAPTTYQAPGTVSPTTYQPPGTVSPTTYQPPGTVSPTTYQAPDGSPFQSNTAPTTYQAPGTVSPTTYQPPGTVSPTTYQPPGTVSPTTYQAPGTVSPTTYQAPDGSPFQSNTTNNELVNLPDNQQQMAQSSEVLNVESINTPLPITNTVSLPDTGDNI